ncbi:MAG: MMPL family transporter [Pirellulales bacterium]|nr:MMPL family transporter [Pirellulales bacterium]
MTQSSFLARRTLGPPNYFLIAVAAAFILGLIPHGVWRAVERNDNAVANWLPAEHAAVRDFAWFQAQFRGGQFIVASWDGCTLGNDEQLRSLARRLRANDRPSDPADAARRSLLFSKIFTGPEMVERMTAPPIGLSRTEAVARLEGFLVGPLTEAARTSGQGDASRATCLIAFLTHNGARDGQLRREAVSTLSAIATTQCGIAADSLRLAGPAVQDAGVGAAAEAALARWAPLCVIAGVGLAFFSLRSWKLAVTPVAVAVFAAAMSLALAYYLGAWKAAAAGPSAPWWTAVDAMTLMIPAVVYALTLAAALYVLNYYLAARREFGADGAAESAVRQAWWPCFMASVGLAAALGVLVASELEPIRRFGLYTAIAIVAGLAPTLALLPAALHRWSRSDHRTPPRYADRSSAASLAWPERFAAYFIRHNGLTAGLAIVAGCAMGAGLLQLTITGRPLALVDNRGDLIRDYDWFESRLGGQMPVELVLTMPPERMRTGDQAADQDGQQYRMTLDEKIHLISEIHSRLAARSMVRGVFSAASLAPASPAANSGHGAGNESERMSAAAAQRRGLIDTDCLQMERSLASGEPTGRELWRIAARVSALNNGEPSVDYDAVSAELRQTAAPVLLAYEQRDEIIRQLSARGRRLSESRIAILFHSDGDTAQPPADAPEAMLGNLLTQSGIPEGALSYVNLAKAEPAAADAAPAGAEQAEWLRPLAHHDAVVALVPDVAPVGKLREAGMPIVDLAHLPRVEESAAVNLVAVPGQRPIRALETGVASLLRDARRSLAEGFANRVLWMAALVFCAMTLAVWSPMGALVAMVPILLPAAVALGAMGWRSPPIDFGTLLAASVGLGTSLVSVLHYLTWFRRASFIGYGRKDAALIASDRCAAAAMQTFLVAGLGMLPLALSGFAPLQKLALLGAAQSGLAVVCTVAVLPAIAGGPLGRFFGGAVLPVDVRDAPGPSVSADSSNDWPTQPAGRPAAMVRIDAGSRPQMAAVSERRDEVEEPHADLHERLRRLRRRAGDSPSN